MPIFTAAFFIQAAITAGTSLFAKRQQDKAQSEALSAAAQRDVNIRPSGSGQDSNIAYGKCAVVPIHVHTSIGQDIPAHDTAYEGALGSIPNSQSGAGTRPPTDGSRAINRYTGTGRFYGIRGDDRDAHQLELFVLSTGEVDKLVDVWLNDKSIIDDHRIGNVSFAKLGLPGVAPPMAKVFVPGMGDGRQITDTDKFTTKSHLSLITWQFEHDPQFGAGVTPAVAFIRGRTLKHIRRTGAGTTSSPYVYTYGGTPSFTNAMPIVRLDYLLNSLYGPDGLTFDADIHAPSWYDAQQRASQRLVDFKNTVAPGVKSENGELVPDPAYTTTYEDIPRLDNGNFDKASPREGLPPQGERGAVFTEHDSSPLRRYEYNGLVPTAKGYLEVRSDMLATAPGAIEFPDHEGKLRLSIPDPYTPAAMQSTATFDDDATVRGTVEVQLPNNSTKCNKVTVTYTDLELDGAAADAVFPASGSPLETQLLSLDNNRKLNTTIQLAGVADHYHAYSIAANLCLTSRRKTFSWRSSYRMFDSAEGDVVRLKDDLKSIDTYVRILTKQPNPIDISWTAIEFFHTDYGWYPESDREVLLPNRLNTDLPKPATVTASHNLDINTTTVTWTASSTINAAGYMVEHRLDEGDWTHLSRTGKDERSTRHLIEIGKHKHKYRVRTEGITGGFSDWTESNELELENVGPLITEEFSGDCPPEDRYALGVRWKRPSDGAEWFGAPDWRDEAKDATLLANGRIRYDTVNGRSSSLDLTAGTGNANISWIPRLPQDEINDTLLVVRGDATGQLRPGVLFARNGVLARTTNFISFTLPSNNEDMPPDIFRDAVGSPRFNAIDVNLASGSEASGITFADRDNPQQTAPYSAGPHLAKDAGKYTMLLEVGGTLYTLPLTSPDPNEPYDLDEPSGFIAAMRTLNAGTGTPDVKLALIDEDLWQEGSNWSNAFLNTTRYVEFVTKAVNAVQTSGNWMWTRNAPAPSFTGTNLDVTQLKQSDRCFREIFPFVSKWLKIPQPVVPKPARPPMGYVLKMRVPTGKIGRTVSLPTGRDHLPTMDADPISAGEAWIKTYADEEGADVTGADYKSLRLIHRIWFSLKQEADEEDQTTADNVRYLRSVDYTASVTLFWEDEDDDWINANFERRLDSQMREISPIPVNNAATFQFATLNVVEPTEETGKVVTASVDPLTALDEAPASTTRILVIGFSPGQDGEDGEDGRDADGFIVDIPLVFT